MYDWILLGLVAAGFYLLECCAWISIPCWACFRDPLTGRWRPALAADLIGNDRGGILLSAPFDLSGTVVQCSEWPLTVSPEGVLNVPVTDSETQEPEYISFEQIESVGCLLETVLINGRPFVKAPSDRLAAELSAILQQITSTRRRDREKLIRSAIRERLNVADVKQRWQRFRVETRSLRLASLLSAAWLFLVGPIALLLFGPLASWPFLLLGLLAGAASTAVLYFRAHRRLLGVSASDRWVHAVSMTLFPPAALRACDRLARELLWPFEPLAVVAAFCDADASAGVVRPAVFDLSRPVAVRPVNEGTTCKSWHRDVLQSEVSRMLRDVDCDPLVAPAADDVSMLVFCPRCHTQYVEERLTCARCAEVSLVPFSTPPGRQAVLS